MNTVIAKYVYIIVGDIKIVHFLSTNAKSIHLSGYTNNFWMKFRGCSSLNSIKFEVSYQLSKCNMQYASLALQYVDLHGK